MSTAIGMVKERRERLIDSRPLFTMVLASWRPILPRPFRQYIIAFLMDVETNVRSRELWVSMVSTEIAAGIYNTIKNNILNRIASQLLKR